MKYAQGENFRFGVTAHNPTHNICTGYPRRFMHEHIRLAKELGVTLYRVDVGPDDLEWFDELIQELEKNEIKLLVNLGGDAEFAGRLAAKYRGRVLYYQVLNEIDGATIRLEPGKPDPDGKQISHYHLDKLADAAATCRRVIAALRAADPAAKILINGTWIHYGMLDYMLQNGVDIDLIGWDWYSNMEGYGIDRALDDLLQYGKDIIICETNIWPTTHTDADRAGYLTDMMEKLYHHPSGRIRGMVVYELLDEPGHQTEGERTFGIVTVEPDNTPAAPKAAYTAIQKLLR